MRANFVSFDADGFTLNFSQSDTTAYKVNYVAFGGTDITNSVIKTLTSAGSTGFAA